MVVMMVMMMTMRRSLIPFLFNLARPLSCFPTHDVHPTLFLLQVMLDGVPVHKYDHCLLHRKISIVGQEPTLYARSIRENIIYGLEGKPRETKPDFTKQCT